MRTRSISSVGGSGRRSSRLERTPLDEPTAPLRRAWVSSSSSVRGEADQDPGQISSVNGRLAAPRAGSRQQAEATRRPLGRAATGRSRRPYRFRAGRARGTGGPALDRRGAAPQSTSRIASHAVSGEVAAPAAAWTWSTTRATSACRGRTRCWPPGALIPPTGLSSRQMFVPGRRRPFAPSRARRTRRRRRGTPRRPSPRMVGACSRRRRRRQ